MKIVLIESVIIVNIRLIFSYDYDVARMEKAFGQYRHIDFILRVQKGLTDHYSGRFDFASMCCLDLRILIIGQCVLRAHVFIVMLGHMLRSV